MTTTSQKAGTLVALMLQFWFADKLGQLWLSLHKGLRHRLGEMPGECALVARGVQLPARRLQLAESFAAGVWWRASMALILLAFPVLGIAAALHPGRFGRQVAAGLILLLGCMAMIALLQLGVLSFRAGQTSWHLAQAGPGAEDEPLPRGSMGLPSRADFWVVLIIAVAVFGILLYAGTRSAHF
jgi:hypothetical protein